MLLLALETATDVCSVALLRDDRVVFDASIRLPRQHAARLVPLVETGLTAIGAIPLDLDAVAVSAGPGSFTGLRIGLSAAQGLCVAASADLVLVPTLEAMARSAPVAREDEVVLASLPSRRGEAYLGAYRSGLCVREPASVPLTEVGAWLPSGPAIVVGPAAPEVAAALPSSPAVRVLPDVLPDAVSVGRLGLRLLRAGAATAPDAAVPDYLRATVATPPSPRA